MKKAATVAPAYDVEVLTALSCVQQDLEGAFLKDCKNHYLIPKLAAGSEYGHTLGKIMRIDKAEQDTPIYINAITRVMKILLCDDVKNSSYYNQLKEDILRRFDKLFFNFYVQQAFGARLFLRVQMLLESSMSQLKRDDETRPTPTINWTDCSELRKCFGTTFSLERIVNHLLTDPNNFVVQGDGKIFVKYSKDGFGVLIGLLKRNNITNALHSPIVDDANTWRKLFVFKEKPTAKDRDRFMDCESPSRSKNLKRHQSHWIKFFNPVITFRKNIFSEWI